VESGKSAEFSFSLQKDEKESLKELRTADMELYWTSNREVGSQCFKNHREVPKKILLLIDGSLSMVNLKTVLIS